MRDREKEIDLLQRIDRYLNGELSESEVDELWVEFLKEPEYLELMEAEAAARLSLEKRDNGGGANSGGRGGTPPTDGSAPRRWFYSVSALLVVLMIFKWVPLRDSKKTAGLLAHIPVEELITVDIFRSGGDQSARPEESDGRAGEMINRGYRTALSGDVPGSLAIYSALLEKELPLYQKGVVRFNAGLLLYNQTRYEEAAMLFEQALATESLVSYQKEKAMWFLGQTLGQLNDHQSVLELMEEIVALEGSYSREAEQMSRQLEATLTE